MWGLVTHPIGRKAVDALVNSQREDPSPAVHQNSQAYHRA